MGQRSQIYVKLKDKNGKIHLIAKYFQWNYGERFISRARYGIEYIKEQKDYIGLDSVKSQINRIFDVNFDMYDILDTTNIIEEYLIYGRKYENNFKDYVFREQDNNDGKLFIEVDETSDIIKYCFTDYDLNIFKNARAYMDWDYENWLESEYLSDEAKNKCAENIEIIDKNAVLMTEKELQDFIDDDYTDFILEARQQLNRKIKWLKGEF